MSGDERLPQRFRFKRAGRDYWDYGLVSQNTFGSLYDWGVEARDCHSQKCWGDPRDTIDGMLGSKVEFQWIDNDYGWRGDVMPAQERKANV